MHEAGQLHSHLTTPKTHPGISMTALERANRALLTALFDVTPREPYAASILRARRARDPSADAHALLAHWDSVHTGSTIGTTRYRWLVSHRHVELPRWAGPPQGWIPWRPAEKAVEEERFDFEARLSIPAIVTDCGELLAELAGEADVELAARARERLAEAEPVMRREFAKFVMASHAWSDTFALWCLARRPRLFERLQPLALAIATCYAATASAEGGVERRDSLLHHVPGDEPPLPRGDRGRLRHRGRVAGGRRHAAGRRSLPDFRGRDRGAPAWREERDHRAWLRHGGGAGPARRVRN